MGTSDGVGGPSGNPGSKEDGTARQAIRRVRLESIRRGTYIPLVYDIFLGFGGPDGETPALSRRPSVSFSGYALSNTSTASPTAYPHGSLMTKTSSANRPTAALILAA